MKSFAMLPWTLISVPYLQMLARYINARFAMPTFPPTPLSLIPLGYSNKI